MDLYWTLDGDIAIGEDGDIRDTSFDELRTLYQEVRTRVQSSFKDWYFHPTLGSNLDQLIGRPNNRATAEEGKEMIISALAMGGFLSRNAINIKYVPVSKNILYYLIQIPVMIQSGRTRMLQTTILFDTSEGAVTVM